MAFGSMNSRGQGSQTLSEINMVPLIDVMLVLLVIFMITAPLLSHSVVVDLPRVTSQTAVEKPDVIDVAIDDAGQIYWNDQPLELAELGVQMAQAAARQPQPSLNLRADRGTRYEVLAEILGMASRSGMKGIGFVTTPGSGASPNAGSGQQTVAAGATAAAPQVPSPGTN